MWGYIDGWTGIITTKRVPSLYVRVYRMFIVGIMASICSLIICEGISQTGQPGAIRTVFPHYMWGYIAPSKKDEMIETVPSLYVRVYRRKISGEAFEPGSLIICEGISLWEQINLKKWLFPHYMWGYIEVYFNKDMNDCVPSLYVRVYRSSPSSHKSLFSSLIICEGISYGREISEKDELFPHYMWGYITATNFSSCPSGVPSLYVRVYRTRGTPEEQKRRSLIICEGISRARRNARAAEEFPHYMWGYIAATGAERRVRRLPSLYVRVYHQHGKLLKSLKCSLIICEGISGTLIFGGWWILFPHYMWGYISTISSR